MGDPLADLIGLLRPRAVLYKHLGGSGSWQVRFAGNRDIVFSLVTAGSCQLFTAAGPIELTTGDFVLGAAPSDVALGSDPTAIAIDGDAADWSVPDPEATTRLIAGHFVLDATNAPLLMGLLPGFVHLRGTDDTTGRISRLLAMIGDEAQADRPGADIVLERLVQVMLIEALRGGARPDGLLSGLADPSVAAALRALHADVARPWTVAGLAHTVNLSRSALAQRFTTHVGTSPMEYLLSWRMALARDALARGHRNLPAIASAVGYGSASAFSTAFPRQHGVSPGRYRDLHRDH